MSIHGQYQLYGNPDDTELLVLSGDDAGPVAFSIISDTSAGPNPDPISGTFDAATNEVNFTRTSESEGPFGLHFYGFAVQGAGIGGIAGLAGTWYRLIFVPHSGLRFERGGWYGRHIAE